MTNGTPKLTDILQEVCNRTASEPWFAEHHYEAISQDAGDLNSVIEEKLFMTGGGSLIMFAIEGFDPKSSASKNIDGILELVAMVSEKAELNRTRENWAPAFAVVENLMHHLNLETLFTYTLYEPSFKFRPTAGLLSYRVVWKMNYVIQGIEKQETTP